MDNDTIRLQYYLHSRVPTVKGNIVMHAIQYSCTNFKTLLKTESVQIAKLKLYSS